MELLNAELQLQSGEGDVTNGLLALNVAQDFFESVAAKRAGILGSASGTVTTTASTETTSFPSGLLRLDRLQLLDATTSRPKRELRPLRRTGGHAGQYAWPINIVTSSTTGEPVAYWTNGVSIYWDPLPNGTHTVRWYGFSARSDITAGGTFAYQDVVAFPLAVFAVKLLKVGVEDPTEGLDGLAEQTFSPVLDTLGNFNRDGASGFEYTEVHDA